MDRRGFLGLLGGAVVSSVLPIHLPSLLHPPKPSTIVTLSGEECFGKVFRVIYLQVGDKKFKTSEVISLHEKISVQIDENGVPKLLREKA